MSENSTGKMRDRTNLKRLDSLTDEEIEQAARSDADTLLLEECDMASLEVVMPERNSRFLCALTRMYWPISSPLVKATKRG